MKLIVVRGEKSSGKTSSIKLAAKTIGMDFSASTLADIQCVAWIKIGARNKLFGIGSAGDSAGAIRTNLLFFKDHPLDFVICACSAPKKGIPLLEAYALVHEAEITWIDTQRVSGAKIFKENQAIAKKIVEAIRK